MATIFATEPPPSPAEDRKRVDPTKDPVRSMYQRPASGRTTALGRRVEKPGPNKDAGPSGQREDALGDAKHANK